MKLDDDSKKELLEILQKARRVRISSIPDIEEERHQYMKEMISSLKEDEAIQINAPNHKVADRLVGRWKYLAVGLKPHICKIKQSDDSYLIYLWLGDSKKGVIKKRSDTTAESELREILKKAKKIRISSIPDATQSKYDYMRELLSSLGEKEAIEMHVNDYREANTLRSRWRQLAVGRRPHTQVMKQSDGSYLVYLWLGQTVLDEILKLRNSVRRGVRKPW